MSRQSYQHPRPASRFVHLPHMSRVLPIQCHCPEILKDRLYQTSPRCLGVPLIKVIQVLLFSVSQVLETFSNSLKKTKTRVQVI